MTLSEKLAILSTWRGAQDGASSSALWDIRGALIGVLNDIDRDLHYGNPGAGFDHLLGTKDRPINIREAA